jgi:reverse gyrase
LSIDYLDYLSYEHGCMVCGGKSEQPHVCNKCLKEEEEHEKKSGKGENVREGMKTKKIKYEGQIILNFTIFEEIEYNDIVVQASRIKQLINNFRYQDILKEADLIGLENITYDKREIK